jgi:hypothetical protein
MVDLRAERDFGEDFKPVNLKHRAHRDKELHRGKMQQQPSLGSAMPFLIHASITPFSLCSSVPSAASVLKSFCAIHG